MRWFIGWLVLAARQLVRTASNPSEKGLPVQLTLNGLSALKVLRTLRKSGSWSIDCLSRVELEAPNPPEGTRWTSKKLVSFLSPHGCVARFSETAPLNIAVPNARDRVRARGVRSTVLSADLPTGVFVDVGGGLAISSPELLFVELARVMPFEVHILLGMELCGTFARDAEDPRSGPVTYHVPPVTSVDRIHSFIDGCKGTAGLQQARESLEWLLDNAWSPMEAAVAMLMSLPAEQLGYGLWSVSLNPRIPVEEGTGVESRVPDLVFGQTGVGLNYDGEDHLPMRDVVSAALRMAREPSQAAGQELTQAVARVRDGSVSDKRRDRDLAAAGMTVLAITKEDLYERGGLDRLVLQVIETIERVVGRRLDRQRAVLDSQMLSDIRQELIWSLLPGRAGIEHSHVYAELFGENPDVSRYMRFARFEGGRWHIWLQDRATGEKTVLV